MSPHHADHMRGLSVFNDNRAGSIDPDHTRGELVKEVSLCPGARVYSYTLVARYVGDPLFDGDPPVPVDAIGAILHLQDSTIEVPMMGCRVASVRGDLSKGTDGGLAWPQFARLEAPRWCLVSLVLTYGHCA